MSQVVEAQPGGGSPEQPVDPSSYDGLALRKLTKHFGSFFAVRDLDLDVPRGSFFALLGPSGCGKTTTLRMVAGLETPSSGTITLAGQDITRAKPYQRPVNTVFQSYALFPHLDIYENVAFGLRRRKNADIDTAVREMLDLVELGSQARKKPAQLSGGQQQRVALARALINSPEVLLLDEPLGALDLKLRRSMQIEIKRIQTEVGLTFIHVTHDQEEAMTMADTVAVMNAGVIEQLGAPAELYENPRSTFVANFLGQSNLIEGTVKSRASDFVTVDMHGIAVSVPAARSHAPGDHGWIGIRPEKVLIGEEGQSLDAPGNAVPGGVVSDVSFVGVSTLYLVRMPWGQEIQVFSQNTGRHRLFAVGDKVELSWRPEYAFLLDAAQDAFAGAQRVDADG
jgi:spermidine/putrescine transport system ATP-binding protein